MEPLLIRAGYLPLSLKSADNFVARSGKSQPRILDGTGIVPINGVLVFEDSILTSFFGGRTYQDIRDILSSFANDPKVKAVILDINSPGGDVYGVSELAEYIRSYHKPVVAYVAGQAASAAYWLASAADKIVAHKTAFVGSIGSYAVVQKSDENESYIVSEQSPKKIPDPLTDDGAAQIREHMNTIAAHFIHDVAEYRGVNEKIVQDDFGQGDVVNSLEAQKVGMIDFVGNFNTAVEVAGGIKKFGKSIKSLSGEKNFGGNKMAKNKFRAEFVVVDSDAVGDDIPVQEVTADLVKELFPDVAQQLIDDGKQLQAAETAEIDEAASMADMSDEEEKEAVASARAKKISASELTKKLLQIKQAKLRAANVLAARAADNPPPLIGSGEMSNSRTNLVEKLRLVRNKK